MPLPCIFETNIMKISIKRYKKKKNHIHTHRPKQLSHRYMLQKRWPFLDGKLFKNKAFGKHNFVQNKSMSGSLIQKSDKPL